MSFIEYELGDRFKGIVLENEPMSRHTTYRIGGPARYFIQADTLGSLVDVTELLRCCGIPWIAVGKGSNLLVSDEGFEGAVEVLALIHAVQDAVGQRYGIELVPEVRFLGFA